MTIRKDGKNYIVTQELAGLILTFRHQNRLVAIKHASHFILGNLAKRLG